MRFSKKAFTKRVKKMEKGAVRHAKRFVIGRLDRLSDVRRRVLSWILLVTLLVGVSATQWMFFRDSFTTTAFRAGGTYSEGVLGPLETLNPIFARSSAEKSAARLLFGSLYQYDESGVLKGDLAKTVAVNDEETEYTITLREDLKWSDGTKLTSDDIVFTTDLLKDPQTRAGIAGWGAIKASAKDQQTVVFTLPAPYAPFMHALTFPILPKHSLGDVSPSELLEHPYSQSPITSGPFALRLLQKTTKDGSKKIVHMVSNPYYHGGMPDLDRYQLYVYPTKEAIEKGLKTKEIIATPELIYASLPENIQKEFSSSSYGVNDGVYALFNTQSDILKSQKVRSALALAIDKDVVRKVLSRSVLPLEGPLLASSVDTTLESSPARDIARAKQLLDEDGWKLVENQRTKDGATLTLSVVVLKDSDYEKAADALANIWQKELQIKTEIKVVDPADMSQDVLQSVLQPRNFDILLYTIELGGDPDVYGFWHSSQAREGGLNFSNYSNDIADDALVSGRSKSNENLRADRYKAFVRRWQADVPAVALYQPEIDYIQSTGVRTIENSSELVYRTDRYANVVHWSVRKAPVYKTP